MLVKVARADRAYDMAHIWQIAAVGATHPRRSRGYRRRDKVDPQKKFGASGFGHFAPLGGHVEDGQLLAGIALHSASEGTASGSSAPAVHFTCDGGSGIIGTGPL